MALVLYKPRAPVAAKTARKDVNVQLPAALSKTWSTRFSVSNSKRFRDAILVEGTEYLAAVSAGGTSAPGQALLNLDISPHEFAGTRLELFSRLYEKYLFDQLDFEYIPAVGSTTVGQLVIAYDRDVSDATPAPGTAGLRAYTSYADSRVCAVWERCTARCPLEAPDSGYYVNPVPGGDDRISYQGQIYVATALPTPINTVLGGLLLHYRCHLFIPNFESESPLSFAASQPTTGQAPAGVTNTSILGKIVAGVGGAVLAAQSDPKYQPFINAAGQAVIRFAEGVYRVAASGDSNSGTPAINPPVLTALQPQPAPAPQPSVVAINALAATATGAPVMADYLIDIPVGGADMIWTANAASSTIDHLRVNINKEMTGYWDAALSALVV